VEGLNDVRTLLANFFSILLKLDGKFSPMLNPLGFDLFTTP